MPLFHCYPASPIPLEPHDSVDLLVQQGRDLRVVGSLTGYDLAQQRNTPPFFEADPEAADADVEGQRVGSVLIESLHQLEGVVEGRLDIERDGRVVVRRKCRIARYVVVGGAR